MIGDGIIIVWAFKNNIFSISVCIVDAEVEQAIKYMFLFVCFHSTRLNF